MTQSTQIIKQTSRLGTTKRMLVPMIASLAKYGVVASFEYPGYLDCWNGVTVGVQFAGPDTAPQDRIVVQGARDSASANASNIGMHWIARQIKARVVR